MASTKPAWTSASSLPAQSPVVLVVDDDRATRMTLQEALQKHGCQVVTAESGDKALDIFDDPAAAIDAIVLDREMPGKSGLEVVSYLKGNARMKTIPVVMLTGTGDQDKIQEGIDAGVYYYLVKPVEATLLHSVVDAAVREKRQKSALLSEIDRRNSALRKLESCRLSLQTLAEAEDTASWLASSFPDPERVVSGLMELLINAVEHGNLAISFDEKQQLLKEGRWAEEVGRRVKLPENESKTVDVVYQRKDGNYLVQITDMGNGFDWKRYWHINPSRASASNGRGIARARLTAFDRISYNEKGNSVTVMVAEKSPRSGDYAW